MEDRRKLPRKYLMAFSLVRDNFSGMELGYLCDMNLEGLMVISKEAHNTGKEMELYMELPEEQDFSKQNILIKARLVWCRADVDPRLYNIGFQFLDLAEEDKPILKKMIEVYEFNRDISPFPLSVSELNKNIQE